MRQFTPVISDKEMKIFLALYRHMLTARTIDIFEEDLTSRGEAFFSVSGAGHEGTAVLQCHLQEQDWLHCHYRDKALMLARGISPLMFFRSVLCKATSHSNGRQMSAHISDPALRVLSIVGPVGNNALQAAGIAAAIKCEPTNPIVLCCMGDGTTQQGEVLEAIGEVVRRELPVLFVVEDNEFSISMKTVGKTFYSNNNGRPKSFYSLPLHYVDGWNVFNSYQAIDHIIHNVRLNRQPGLVIFRVKRLTNHTTADHQLLYRSADDVETSKRLYDPLTIFRQNLREVGVAEEELRHLDQVVQQEVQDACEQALHEADPDPVFTAKKPIPRELTDEAREYKGKPNGYRLTMREALREVLASRLRTDPRVCLYGEDIEDPKGDVFGVTQGLSAQWPGRVHNSPLAEATIIGTSIGQALVGKRPVAFLQFADFLPLAFNQIVSELGSMYWRTNGGWECPVIVMITCGGYRPGLGPFHAQTFDSISAHVPGLDVMMPSTAGDAAGLLNAAFDSGRPTLFFYPKSGLNDPRHTTSADIQCHRVGIGKACVVRKGTDLTLVAWGNCVSLCLKVAKTVSSVDLQVEVIDLRCLSPWDTQTVLSSVQKTNRLIVVHEDNRTCGFGAEVLATVAELCPHPVTMRRVTRADTYVPCNFANQLAVLPSFTALIATVAEILSLDLQWIQPLEVEEDLYVVEAFGPSPSDEELTVLEWKVKEGDHVDRDQLVVELEASKAIAEIAAPVEGQVVALLIPEGGVVNVGSPLLHIRTHGQPTRKKPPPKEVYGTPVLTKKLKFPPKLLPRPVPQTFHGLKATDVLLSRVCAATGCRSITNQDLIGASSNLTSSDIVQRTGIEQRNWVGDGETALTLALDAIRKLLSQEGLRLEELDAIICSTGTPFQVTPSMACQLLSHLAPIDHALTIQAFDVNAACSGYLYALQIAYDFLQAQPKSKALVVTTEVLSPLLNPADFSTRILFGDAASATLLKTNRGDDPSGTKLRRPLLWARGDSNLSICVPTSSKDQHISMNGKKIFSEAVKAMAYSLERCCQENDMGLEDLALVIPHQANQRILDAVGRRLGLSSEKIYSNIQRMGNTSSSSIPICLSECLVDQPLEAKIGLCAFGGGFTFGAVLIEKF